MATPDDLILAQAPIVRPDPIPRPEPIERPMVRRPVNPFDKYVKGAEDQVPQKSLNPFDKYVTQDNAAPVEAPRPLNFGQPSQQGINPPQSVNPDIIRKALEDAPPDVRERALREWASTQPDNPMLPDILKSFGVGIVKGVTGLATLPDTMGRLVESGAEWVGASPDTAGIAGSVVRGALGPGQPRAISYDQATKAIEDVAGPLYKPKTLPGEYAQTVGEFVPGGITPGGIGRKIANVVLPAVTSETAGQIAKDTALETPARIAGAVVGGNIPNALRRARTPFPNPDPERQRLVDVLDREGINLTAGDRTGRKSLRYAESAANDTPFSGQRIAAQKELQGEQFTQAALRRAGIRNATRATDEVIDAQYRRLGQEFESFAQNTAVPITPRLIGQAQQIIRQYERLTPEAARVPAVREFADEILGLYQRGGRFTPTVLPGPQYGRWRSVIGAAARSTQDPVSEQALYSLQRLLDDAAEQTLRQRGGFMNNGMADQMRQTRREYRNLLVISKARGAGEDAAMGILNPRQLQQAAKQMEGWQAYSRGRGDFTELAKAGNAVLTPLPQSGTAPRLVAHGILNTLGAIGGTLLGGPAGGLGGAVGTQVAQGVGARMLMSRPVQSYLGNQTRTRAIEESRRRDRNSILSGILASREREQRQ